MNKSKRTITVVVPIYKDWPSLNDCIGSLDEHLDSRHKVILVNDCSDEVDEIEKNIKAKVGRNKKFSYFRNEKNLGFVKTCNRAVFELDKTDNDVLLLNSDTMVTAGSIEEMLEVLYATDRHAVATPRSDNASINSIAPRFIDSRTQSQFEQSYEVYNKVKDHMPRYKVVPVGVGFCMLIKRTIINNFGLFDEEFGLGYNEENDFCLRINQYGYSAVMCNRAFVFHVSSRSFGEALKKELNEKNGQTLEKRYPFYPTLIERYLNSYISPVDHFAFNIAGLDKKKKLLIDLYHFPTAFNGTTKAGISLLKYLKKNGSKFDITILVQKESEKFHDIDQYGFKTVTPDKLEDVYDLGYCPQQIFHFENLAILNRHCLRIVFALFDIITIRCNYLLMDNIKLRDIFVDSLRIADKVVTISDFAADDTKAYFNNLTDDFEKKLVTIPMGYPGSVFKEDESVSTLDLSSLPEDYILIFGNNYHHKAVKKIIPYIKETKYKYVILGTKGMESNDNITIFPSGLMSDEAINKLIQNCQFVIFPSQYEGFGLPVLEAATHGKRCVYYQSDVGDEVSELVSNKQLLEGFTLFSNLPAIIDRLMKSPLKVNAKPKIRALDDYNKETMDLLEKTASSKFIEFEELDKRWQYVTSISEYYHNNLHFVNAGKSFKLRLIKIVSMNPHTKRVSRRIYKVLKRK